MNEPTSGVESRNLIINYLPYSVTEARLRNIFGDAKLKEVKVVRDRNTKMSLGYGFVKFIDFKDAVEAVEEKNGYEIEGKRLKVSFARPPSNNIKNCKLYVTNLPRDYDHVKVSQLFAHFGEIIECRVLRDTHANQYKGVAFIQFAERSQSDAALSLNDTYVPGGTRHLRVKYSDDNFRRSRGTPPMIDTEEHVEMIIEAPVSYPTAASSTPDSDSDRSSWDSDDMDRIMQRNLAMQRQQHIIQQQQLYELQRADMIQLHRQQHMQLSWFPSPNSYSGDHQDVDMTNGVFIPNTQGYYVAAPGGYPQQLSQGGQSAQKHVVREERDRPLSPRIPLGATPTGQKDTTLLPSSASDDTPPPGTRHAASSSSDSMLGRATPHKIHTADSAEGDLVATAIAVRVDTN